jgi:hypothetical protein
MPTPKRATGLRTAASGYNDSNIVVAIENVDELPTKAK